MELLIGLMSGTSADGADAVAVSFDEKDFRLHGRASMDFPPALSQRIVGLNRPSTNDLHQAAVLGLELAQCYAQLVEQLLATTKLQRARVHALAVHGQTLRHRPDAGVSIQAGNLARLAELCGMDVIGDFRSRDLAAGGQGAPLASGFHRWVFAGHQPCAVLNLGGVANLTLIEENRQTGFDTGPANLLLDAWAQQQLGKPHDTDGRWAASAAPDERLVKHLLGHTFFAKRPPKSTGRDDFHLRWLNDQLNNFSLEPAVVQASLVQLSVRSIAAALADQAPHIERLIACGGGVYNHCLWQQLQQAIAPVELLSCKQLGIPPKSMEALAFAWLGWRFLHRQPSNLPQVTGAAGPRVLGALYPQ